MPHEAVKSFTTSTTTTTKTLTYFAVWFTRMRTCITGCYVDYGQLPITFTLPKKTQKLEINFLNYCVDIGIGSANKQKRAKKLVQDLHFKRHLEICQ